MQLTKKMMLNSLISNYLITKDSLYLKTHIIGLTSVSV